MEKSSFPLKLDQDVVNYLKEIIYNQNEKFLSLEKRLDTMASQLNELRTDLLTKFREDKQITKEQKDIWKEPESEETSFSEQYSSSFSTSGKPESYEEYGFQNQQNTRETDSNKILQEFTNYHKKKSQVESSALKSYLAKLERVIIESWGKTKLIFNDKQYLQFLDLGLTVLHGIIEYTYVAHFRKIPENSLDYFSKAKAISSAGILKDLNLLDKMESVFSDKQTGNKPVLAKTVIRGWYERLDRIFIDWNFRVQNAPF